MFITKDDIGKAIMVSFYYNGIKTPPKRVIVKNVIETEAGEAVQLYIPDVKKTEWFKANHVVKEL